MLKWEYTGAVTKSTRGLFGHVDRPFVLDCLFGVSLPPLMFRSRLVHCRHRLYENGTRRAAKPSLVKRFYASGATAQSSNTLRRVALWTSALGGVSIVGAYFVWPDVSRSAPTLANVALSPSHFTPVAVTSTTQCKDPNTRLMTLTVPRESMPPLQEGLFAPIWSIFIKDDDIQVERPYTPLEGIDDRGRMKFWIKRYPKGEVGRWLHSKREGDQIEVRGPLKSWPWQERKWDEIVMVSTPQYRLLHTVLIHHTDFRWNGHNTFLSTYILSTAVTDSNPYEYPLHAFALLANPG